MDTSLSNALSGLFSAFATELSLRNIPPGSVEVYLFGGCAVHLYTSYRTSSDVDVELACSRELISKVRMAQQELPAFDFEDPEAGPTLLTFDLTFNTTLGPLHEDYTDRAVVWRRFGDGVLTVKLPHPVDLAISKLGRLVDVDMEDILRLLELPEAPWELFEELALEASQYYVGPPLTNNINYVKSRHGR